MTEQSKTKFQQEIQEAASTKDDIRLLEVIERYVAATRPQQDISNRELRAMFVAARSNHTQKWAEMTPLEKKAVQDVTSWTGYSPATIATMLRTLARATPDLKEAWRLKKIARYTVSTISELYKPGDKYLQKILIELVLQQELTQADLKELVKQLKAAPSKRERETVLTQYRWPNSGAGTVRETASAYKTTPTSPAGSTGVPRFLFEGLIVKNPDLRGGRPTLAGTGVTVRTIAGHYKLGLSAEEIADEMNLEPVLVYAALTYYHFYRDEIEADLLADSEERLHQEFQEWLRARA